MRRSTVVILLLLVIVAGVYYYVNNRAKSTDNTVSLTQAPTKEVSYLFNAQDGIPNDIRVESQTGETVELARDDKNAWAVKLPIAMAADQGSAEAAASQLTTIQITDKLAARAVNPNDVGLDKPKYILTVKYANGVERKANIGVVTPSESGYYAQLDDDSQIVIVSKDSVDALTGLLTNPPYAQTLTPSPTAPTPTETPVLPTSEPATPTQATPTP
jgi:uncharacterized protein DUF4340